MRAMAIQISSTLHFTNRVQVADLVIVMMVLGAVLVVLVIVRAQLEDVRQRGEQEQDDFEQQFLGGADAHDERQDPEEFDFDQLDDQHDGEEREQEFVAEEFLCSDENRMFVSALWCAMCESLHHIRSESKASPQQ